MSTKTWTECRFLTDADGIKEYFSGDGKTLFVLGKGFDPRSCMILQMLKPAIRDLTVCLVDYNDRTINENKSNESRSRENYEQLLRICADLNIVEIQVPQYGGNGGKKTLVISESVRKAFVGETIWKFERLLIDISAMPRSVAFSVIKRLYAIKLPHQQLSILVCENSEFDERIKPVIMGESAEYLPGFNTFSLSMESSQDDIIWLPALGMYEEDAFNIIADYLKPVEICPVVPFPATDARRGENLLRFYGETIFRDRNVEKRNIIYVPENNPVLIYQKMYDTVQYYEKALRNGEEDRSIQYVFSSQSSKLIDLGMLMAVMDLQKADIKTGIVVVKNQGYIQKENYEKETEKIYCLCLDDNEFNW